MCFVYVTQQSAFSMHWAINSCRWILCEKFVLVQIAAVNYFVQFANYLGLEPTCILKKWWDVAVRMLFSCAYWHRVMLFVLFCCDYGDCCRWSGARAHLPYLPTCSWLSTLKHYVDCKTVNSNNSTAASMLICRMYARECVCVCACVGVPLCTCGAVSNQICMLCMHIIVKITML